MSEDADRRAAAMLADLEARNELLEAIAVEFESTGRSLDELLPDAVRRVYGVGLDELSPDQEAIVDKVVTRLRKPTVN